VRELTQDEEEMVPTPIIDLTKCDPVERGGLEKLDSVISGFSA
jgi:hypothetical protein